jgi:hypothetical protein
MSPSPKPTNTSVLGSGTAVPWGLISVCPRLMSEPPGTSVRSMPRVIENGAGSLTGTTLENENESAGPFATSENVASRVPGRSVEVPAPCLFAGSLNHVRVIVDPAAVTHVPLPLRNDVATGGKKPVALTVKWAVTGALLMLVIVSELLSRMLRAPMSPSTLSP